MHVEDSCCSPARRWRFAAAAASAKDLKAIGITVGLAGQSRSSSRSSKGAEAEAKKINPNVKVTTASADYDLNKQFTQIDNFIAAGVDMILVNAADPKAIAPAVKRAQAAGIVVVGVDVAAAGADATVQTNNTQAGEIACQFMADKIDHKGNVDHPERPAGLRGDRPGQRLQEGAGQGIPTSRSCPTTRTARARARAA